MYLKSINAQTEAGPVLQINEDGYDFDLNNHLYMLFDGFGGAGVGDRAVAKLKENLKKFFTKIAFDQNATLPFFFSPKFLIEGNALINSMLYCHELLYKDNLQKEVAQRGGSSAMLMVKSESILTLVSTGNCVAYIYRRGKLKKIFVEDSYLFLSDDDYDGHLKTIPLSGFGLFSDLYYQVKEVRIFEGDLVIAMSDGVYAKILEEELRDTLGRRNVNQKIKIQELLKLANERGNLDNQTAMILEF